MFKKKLVLSLSAAALAGSLVSTTVLAKDNNRKGALVALLLD
ncbi:hypothetical protein [Calidifontibacillus oryziterrae]|nr:hypothetical protein [Calidifontibacillus oryziterrae]